MTLSVNLSRVNEIFPAESVDGKFTSIKSQVMCHNRLAAL